MVFATMLRRTETSHRFYLQRPMVFLFSRPILPYYNKGKKTIYSYLNFIFFFLFLSDCVAHSANLECVLDTYEVTIVRSRKIPIDEDARAVRPYRSIVIPDIVSTYGAYLLVFFLSHEWALIFTKMPCGKST